MCGLKLIIIMICIPKDIITTVSRTNQSDLSFGSFPLNLLAVVISCSPVLLVTKEANSHQQDKGTVLTSEGSGYFRKCSLEECLSREWITSSDSWGWWEILWKENLSNYTTKRVAHFACHKTATDYYVIWYLHIHQIYVLICTVWSWYWKLIRY